MKSAQSERARAQSGTFGWCCLTVPSTRGVGQSRGPLVVDAPRLRVTQPAYGKGCQNERSRSVADWLGNDCVNYEIEKEEGP